MISNWIRLLKNNLVNNIGIFIIVTLTIFLGTIFLESNQNINDCIDKIEEGNMQDFSFYPNVSSKELEKADNNYSEALNNKVEELAAKYNFKWESMEFRLIKEDEHIFRLYSSERDIDQLYIVEGIIPKQNQICVDYSYASANDIKVNDILNINNAEYLVSGICVFPDQLYPIVDNTGILYDKASQGIVALNQADYHNLTIDKNLFFAGKFHNSADNTKAMERDKDFYCITSSAENTQIYAAIKSQQLMNIIITGFSMGILGTIAILLVIITITRQIKAELSNIGVLKALGYNNREISVKYLAYFIIVFLPAMIGYFLGHYFTPTFYQLICARFEIPFMNSEINVINLLLFSLCPAILAAVVAYTTSIIYIRKPALDLIKEMNRKKNGRFVRIRNNKIKEHRFLRGVKRTLLYSNMLVFVFIIFGGFALGVQIQFAYTTYNMTSNISDKVLEGINYKSDVRYVNVIDSEIEKTNLYYFTKTGRIKLKDNEHSALYDICVLGEGDEKLLELYNRNGTKINLADEDGVIINQLMALKNNLKIGDKVEFVSDNEIVEVSIANISQSTYGSVMFINKNTALSNNLIQKVKYNGMYTNKSIDFDSSVHLSISNVDNIKITINQSTNLYIILSVMLFIFGLVVGTTVLLLSIYGAISNYKKYIAIMKIYGYTEKECSYTVIDGFRMVSLAGFLISIPYSYILCTVMFNLISKNSDMLYLVAFDIKSVIICFLLTVIVTEIIIQITKRQISGISFREIMEH